VSDSVNPAGSRPGGSRGYGASARPTDPSASSLPTSSAPTNPATTGEAAPQVTASGGARSGGLGAAARPVGSQVRVRKARLRVARVDPWSVMKVSFVLSIALGIVSLVGTAVVWEVLSSLGVFSSLDKTVGDLTSGGSGSTGFDLSSVLSFTRVEGYMLIVALVDVVLVTALATLGAYLYNLSSGFVGGLELTLAEDQ